MATNRIIRTINIGIISKAGQKIVVEAAVETQYWIWPESIIDKDKLMKFMQDSATELPEGTKSAVIRGMGRGTDGHTEVVCLDENGKYIVTKHIVPEWVE